MKLLATRLPGVLIVEPAVFADDRGWFMESFNEARFESALAALGQPLPRRFVQDNHSCCLLYTSPSPRDRTRSRMPSSA